jgi:predicted SpoU family rRNA methylase
VVSKTSKNGKLVITGFSLSKRPIELDGSRERSVENCIKIWGGGFHVDSNKKGREVSKC